VDLSLFYFAAEDGSLIGPRYKLLLEGAKFADGHGFSGVWTPERHFHPFGGLYPNPSVTGAAIAAVTERVRVRAGSVVAPLHDPLRVAEEWSVVDNLSGGRIAISFASGWLANDFVLAPENFANRKSLMLESIRTVQALWRGEPVLRVTPSGEPIEVRIFPRPVQAELPTWLTSAGDPLTFRTAGQIGAGVLTHLLGQDITELAAKIEVYRKAQRESGLDGGHVALMLHTFVDDDAEALRAHALGPFETYLSHSLDLVNQWIRAEGEEIDFSSLGPDERDALLSRAAARYIESSSLIGTPEVCRDRLQALEAIGVDEIACLIDFGVDPDHVLAQLPLLAGLGVKAPVQRRRMLQDQYDPVSQIRQRRVTHLQCTPAMAAVLASTKEGLEALGTLSDFLIGGEVFPRSLAAKLTRVHPRVWNMYGPTEATIWSTAHRVDLAAEDEVPIGRPLTNTGIHILDRAGNRVPVGVTGEMFIGGAGVARGYLNRPSLTAERFVPDPFRLPGARMYRTGDLARYRSDGRIEFLGRVDKQIKIRGYRIEPGEVEAELERDPSVDQAVVVLHTSEDNAAALIAYVRPTSGDPDGPWLAPPDEDEQTDLVLLPNGLMVSGGRLAAMTLYEEIFERREYLFDEMYLPNDCCVLDIGANIGMFSLFVHDLCTNPRVYAFEPIPPTFSQLTRNVELNSLPVSIANEGVGARAGFARFLHFPNFSGISGQYVDLDHERTVARQLLVEGIGRAGGDSPNTEAEIALLLEDRFRTEEFDCAVTTVSDILSRYGIEAVDLLKIDVERAEIDVLDGIRDIDWPKIRQIVVEVEGPARLGEVCGRLEGRGLTVSTRSIVAAGHSDGSGIDIFMVYGRQPHLPQTRWQLDSPMRWTAPATGTVRWEARVRDRLRGTLPNYMIPSRVVRVDSFPSTPNGKVDRRRLAELPPERHELRAPVTSPRTRLHRIIAQAWSAVMNVESVNIHENFFDAGGNSMRLLQIHFALKQKLDMPPSLVDLFTYPTIASLAAHLEGKGSHEFADSSDGRRREGREQFLRRRKDSRTRAERTGD